MIISIGSISAGKVYLGQKFNLFAQLREVSFRCLSTNSKLGRRFYIKSCSMPVRKFFECNAVYQNAMHKYMIAIAKYILTNLGQAV